jgi:hypothetical protein
MPASKLVRQLLGESRVTEGTVNIHIHNGKDADDPAVEVSPEVPAGGHPGMPPQKVDLPGARNYVFKVVRDEQGRIAEIYATKLS